MLSGAMDEESFGGAWIDRSKNVLLVLCEADATTTQLMQEFCGTVVTDCAASLDISGKTLYICGNVALLAASIDLASAYRVFVIADISSGYADDKFDVIEIGRVPILVHGVGVFYRRFFAPGNFHRVSTDHSFQTLTESNKPATALRTGIYLTPVTQINDEYHFRLLRCSSNLSGPTGNFSSNDHAIVASLNEAASTIFSQHASMNHVLAQIYHNNAATASQKQAKAKIKAHADKTKDMPSSALMAFCTFYEDLRHLQRMTDNPFDFGHKGISGLTRLHFRLKAPIAERGDCTLKREFSVTLYPDSVFFIPLSTNRLYTHEIRPSQLDASMIPTRLGYVVRCSSTEAVHAQGVTYIKEDNRRIPLRQPTSDDMHHLRMLYARENATDEIIHYGSIHFSMNNGDFEQPLMTEVFRHYMLPVTSNLFDELQSSVELEPVCKGRDGGILIRHDNRGIPIVRTTTKYRMPAQYFREAHSTLAELIERAASPSLSFNNAMIERYTNSYSTMGFHSDQALDLEDGSSIAIFSCYKFPELVRKPRQLVVSPKDVSGPTTLIPLLHNSVVVFTVDTNKLYKHKIILDITPDLPDNEWLGVTLRTSKTFVHFQDGEGYFENGTLLSLATKEQCQEFFSLRRRENMETNFVYPGLSYTISSSDLKCPV